MSKTIGRPDKTMGGPEQLLTRRNLLLAGAILCTVAVFWSLFFNTRTQIARRATFEPVKNLPIDDLMKPGPLPDIVLGAPDAPVTIVEYASLTCPACAAFHNQMLPALKEKYIDTGKARLVFREFPLNDLDLLASVAVRCAANEKAEIAMPMVSVLYARQDVWRSSRSMPELRAKFAALGLQLGVTRAAFNACFPSDVSSDSWSADQNKLWDNLQKNARRGQAFGVDKTPTFFVNGTKLEEAKGIEDFDKAIEPLLKK